MNFALSGVVRMAPLDFSRSAAAATSSASFLRSWTEASAAASSTIFCRSAGRLASFFSLMYRADRLRWCSVWEMNLAAS